MSVLIIVEDTKHAGERKYRGFNLTPYLTNFWEPGMMVPVGFAIRPKPKEFGGLRGSDGYEYVADNTGQTGESEPAWANGVIDGSVTWTRRAITAASLFKTISAPLQIEWIAPAEMTVDAPAFVVDTEVHVAAMHAGGNEGEQHRVIARIPFSDGTIEDCVVDWTILDDQIA